MRVNAYLNQFGHLNLGYGKTTRKLFCGQKIQIIQEAEQYGLLGSFVSMPFLTRYDPSYLDSPM